MSKPKITYFPLQGRGEQCRLILIQAGVEWEDNRVAFQDWPAIKSQQPFGSMPVLNDGDFCLAQGPAIVEYLSNKYGLWPTDVKESAVALSIVLACEDARQIVIPAIFTKDEEEKKKKVAEAVEKIQSVWNKNASKLLGDNKYFVGGKLSGADLAVYDLVKSFTTRVGIKFEQNIMDHMERVGSESNIKNYYEKNPITGHV